MNGVGHVWYLVGSVRDVSGFALREEPGGGGGGGGGGGWGGGGGRGGGGGGGGGGCNAETERKDNRDRGFYGCIPMRT